MTLSRTDLYRELESALPKSTEEQRKVWAEMIVEQDIDLKELSGLLHSEKKTATRFLWMLSRIGMINPGKLFAELPFLLEFSKDLDPYYRTSFANFWLIAGIPTENEGKAIDMSFEWLLSPEVNITIKARAVLVLFKLTEKYPELKNELRLCIIDQKDKYSKDFQKRAGKILRELENEPLN